MITKGTSFYIQRSARAALKRQDLSQVGLSELTGTKKTTMNRYMTDSPTPIETITHIASVLDDGIFNQQMANLVFNVLPVMESEVFSDNPHALEFLANKEEKEPQERQLEALYIFSKNVECITKADKVRLTQYVAEFLDEMLIETRLVLSIIDRTDYTFSDMITQRIHYWIQEGYLTKKEGQ